MTALGVPDRFTQSSNVISTRADAVSVTVKPASCSNRIHREGDGASTCEGSRIASTR